MKITDIEPTKGHVLVELPKKIDKVGEIVLGETTQENNAPVRGTVIRVSKDGSPFNVGEEIFFRKYAVDELKFNEDKLEKIEVFVINEEEVLGVVRPQSEEKLEDLTTMRAESKVGDKKLRDSIR